MFIVRPECLKVILDAKFTPDMWVAGKSHSLGTLAHVYERLLCIAVLDAGYRCNTITTNRKKATKVLIHRRISKTLKSIFTIDRRDEDRKKYMILFGKRFMLE
jgi:lipopolysaccharide biosynthesis protein